MNLSPYDLECIALFLTSSPGKTWPRVLWHPRSWVSYSMSWTPWRSRTLKLENNYFKCLSSSSINDIVLHCQINELSIANNHTVGGGHKLYHNVRVLSCWFWTCRILSSTAAIALFSEIGNGSKLSSQYLSNNIGDNAYKAIAAALKINQTLSWLWMSSNQISAVAVKYTMKEVLSS